MKRKHSPRFSRDLNQLKRLEIHWYRQHGRYVRDRIIVNRDGGEMMIGDWSWNRRYPDKREYIEHAIPYESIPITQCR